MAEVNTKTPTEMEMKSPGEGATASIFLLMGIQAAAVTIIDVIVLEATLTDRDLKVILHILVFIIFHLFLRDAEEAISKRFLFVSEISFF